jgi:hypothetical protein
VTDCRLDDMFNSWWFEVVVGFVCVCVRALKGPYWIWSPLGLLSDKVASGA